ncbi:hypothetical protein M5D96_013823 [Drosophila gunungcola]|uniref:Uncharacterized protein n=1 Tax=Drosophila gunungcola TaxID=103775 RepID=A0A9P9YAL5_9MUSC|nr:hypothetical protein M5D96_013823 [Drosophila gunungcola]
MNRDNNLDKYIFPRRHWVLTRAAATGFGLDWPRCTRRLDCQGSGQKALLRAIARSLHLYLYLYLYLKLKLYLYMKLKLKLKLYLYLCQCPSESESRWLAG